MRLVHLRAPCSRKLKPIPADEACDCFVLRIVSGVAVSAFQRRVEAESHLATRPSLRLSHSNRHSAPSAAHLFYRLLGPAVPPSDHLFSGLLVYPWHFWTRFDWVVFELWQILFASWIWFGGYFKGHVLLPLVSSMPDLPHPDSGRPSIRMERREPCDVRLEAKETDSAVRLLDFGPIGRHIPNPNIISLMLLSILGWRDPISTLIPWWRGSLRI
jgi:hypothetical protein